MSTLKRCHFTDLNHGYKCGCLRCIVISAPDNDGLCKGCGHHQSYHEDDDDILRSLNYHQKFNEALISILNNKYSQYNQYRVPIPVQQNFENWFEPQVTLHSDETMHQNTPVRHTDQQTRQHIEPQNQSHNVLNQSPTHIFEQNSVSQSLPVNYISNQILNPMLSGQNFDQSYVNHNIEGSSNNVASFANEKFGLICLVGSLKIPKNCARLEKAGLKKEICFNNDSNGQIKKAIEDKLSPHLENVDWMFYKCKSSKLVPAEDVSVVECRYNDLKRISGSRKKLYIGTKDGPIIMTLTNNFEI
ncbi:hypothetical protein RhiirA5_419076 [Rhizophagus irregularis]|uniref:Uncharacterized protein n=1 Tax=Rhizophagus irregularis TaxID=588596 RepID=A0A2N0PIZ4_9GLOM|nr:hypothetical protein RhiirA5_419076 [Rhizophagus irregularis]